MISKKSHIETSRIPRRGSAPLWSANHSLKTSALKWPFDKLLFDELIIVVSAEKIKQKFKYIKITKLYNITVLTSIYT